jgi:hypothetical protein
MKKLFVVRAETGDTEAYLYDKNTKILIIVYETSLPPRRDIIAEKTGLDINAIDSMAWVSRGYVLQKYFERRDHKKLYEKFINDEYINL